MPHLTRPDGTEVHHEVHGTGATNVVLIHGLGDDGTAWGAQLPALGSGFRVLTLDLRGHGRSSKDANDHSIATMAADVLAVADEVGMDRAHVVGMSLGGGVAFEVAVQRPDFVTSLVIVNSTPTARVGGLVGRAALGVRQLMARMMTPAKAAPTVAGRLFPDPDQEELREEYTQRLADNDPDAYRASLNALVAFDRGEASRALTMPTLFVHSEHDYTPLKWRQPFVDAMPDATLVQIDGAHHAVPIEKPDAFNRVLLDHLAAHA